MTGEETTPFFQQTPLNLIDPRPVKMMYGNGIFSKMNITRFMTLGTKPIAWVQRESINCLHCIIKL